MTVTTRDTRQEILEAAAELFRKQGYAATTVQQVAELTGISKGNLTYHFASKRALFEAVHEVGVRYVRDRLLLRSLQEAPNLQQGLNDFLRRLKRQLVDREGRFVGCLFTNIAVETRHADPAIADLARDAIISCRQALADFLTLAEAHGELSLARPPVELAHAFFREYEGALTLARALDDPGEFDAFCARIAQTYR
jgi:TetR/AcrR family transcriptional repressor of nem operon